MKFLFSITLLFAFALLPLTIGNTAADAEWPQWRGALRDGKSVETGLLKTWPEKGPGVSWSIANLGEGYGSLAIRGERIYVQGTSGATGEAKSTVFCLNRADGKQIWSVAFGPRLDQDKGNGPRGTPTLDGDRMYVLTENGDLACLREKDGSSVWSKNILKEFGGSNPKWLISESPLIDGNKLIVSPGGKEAGIVALDKMTGKEIWRTKELSAETGYASNIIAEVGGVRSYLNFTSSAAVGVRASDGKLMFSYANASNRTANCATAVLADNKVFFSSAYGTGGALLNLKAENGEVKAEEAYFTKEMMNHHGGMVLVNGYLYGFSNAILTCIEFNTGKVMWKDRSVGKGSLTYADGMLYLLGEKQLVGLAEASPTAYAEKGRFPINDRGWDSWAHPVVLGGKLYIRNQNELTCYDVKAK
ncbi:MAG: PQQ-like beta-propeller repeat protein [Acidobacteria bacterium]|nr:PQQ-like beta-propeller repeat protein [Acidobacteriota bacterium]